MAEEEFEPVTRPSSTTSVATVTSEMFRDIMAQKDGNQGTESAEPSDNRVASTFLSFRNERAQSFKRLGSLLIDSSASEVGQQEQQLMKSESSISVMDRKVRRSTGFLHIGLYRPPSDDWSSVTLDGLPSLIESGPPRKTFESSEKKDSFEKPIFSMKLERLKGEERYDAFSEDEEPVLRTHYTPYCKTEPKKPKHNVTEEKIVVYNVRNGVRSSASEENPQCAKQVEDIATDSRSSKSLGSHSLKKSNRSLISGKLDPNFEDFTPHQRGLTWVSYGELTVQEVAIIKGLWKCITFDLWTFGALTTINFFKLRGFIADNDQKATPEAMMQCRLLWPHAKHAMQALETVVFHLHRPIMAHKLIHEFGKKHAKLKIPISSDQSQLIIEAFLLTFVQQVKNPKLTLKELKILRTFCSITMFLFVDASRWQSTPLLPF